MGKYIALISIFLLFLLGPFAVKNYAERTSTAPVQQVISLNAERLTSLVNEWRVQSGFQPYIRHEALCRITDKRAVEITKNYSHDAFMEIDYPSELSENINKGYISEKDALGGWLGSPPHHEALTKPYRYSCISTKGTFAVQIFSNCENGCY